MNETPFKNKVQKLLKGCGVYVHKNWGGGRFTKSGTPDIFCCIDGTFVAIELKSDIGKVEELQKYHISEINRARGYGFVLYPKDYNNFEKFVNFLNKGYLKQAHEISKDFETY